MKIVESPRKLVIKTFFERYYLKFIPKNPEMLIFAKKDPKIRNATSEKYTLNFGTSPYHHIG